MWRINAEIVEETPNVPAVTIEKYVFSDEKEFIPSDQLAGPTCVLNLTAQMITFIFLYPYCESFDVNRPSHSVTSCLDILFVLMGHPPNSAPLLSEEWE